jgi:hypothetical protein
MLVDRERNEYYGANVDSQQPPQQRWDKGRAGKKLNDSYSLILNQVDIVPSSFSPATISIQLRNNSLNNKRIVIRAIKGEKEIIRERTYQPWEVYPYEFEKGTKLYILSEQQGQTLMNSKGKATAGRLLLELQEADKDKVFDF